MKLHHLAQQTPENQRLRNLGKALTGLATDAKIAEAKTPQRQRTASAYQEDKMDVGIDAAIHTLTQDQKHLHMKIAHHD